VCLIQHIIVRVLKPLQFPEDWRPEWLRVAIPFPAGTTFNLSKNVRAASRSFPEISADGKGSGTSST
jgi:hypothetical protein